MSWQMSSSAYMVTTNHIQQMNSKLASEALQGVHFLHELELQQQNIL